MRVADALIGAAASLFLIACNSNPSTQRDDSPLPPKAYDPLITLHWPGEPQTTFHDQTTHKSYRVSLSQIKAASQLAFYLDAMEFSDDVYRKSKPDELLDAYLAGSQKYETKRDAVTFGKQKFPAMEIRRKRPTDGTDWFTRLIVFLVGPRMYAISVMSPDEHRVNGNVAQAFFNSANVTAK